MATYAIGDLQGCYDELLALLDTIHYDPRRDCLWFCGDLVNRGPKSLECLRFILQCGEGAQAVLGNHDLHLLAIAAGVQQQRPDDTLEPVLSAEDLQTYLNWLRARPLIAHHEDSDFYMLHAGIHPHWDMDDARSLSDEVCRALRADDYQTFLHDLYSNKPEHWSPTLTGRNRMRFIVNSLTRMRYLKRDTGMEYDHTGPPGQQPDGLIPWYCFPGRRNQGTKLVFGHWSTITLGTKQDFPRYQVYPLDTGCVWGGRLSALRLEDEQSFSVPSRQKRP